ncbi:MAG: hypothetical protein NW237_02730 [Cyanobacteriota bacterium]|nr:hypothetical protein [Cyanobacteriota bacterium]
MARKPDEYLVHIMLDGGHHLQVRVSGAKEYSTLINEIMMGGQDFINLPKQMDNESMLIRPNRVCGVSVEAVFASSVGIEMP